MEVIIVKWDKLCKTYNGDWEMESMCGVEVGGGGWRVFGVQGKKKITQIRRG